MATLRQRDIGIIIQYNKKNRFNRDEDEKGKV